MVSEIVLNFLLWYIHEQIKQSLKEKLRKVVLSFYSGRAIEKQKNVIFANFPDLEATMKRAKTSSERS